jgi:hypothetical protein
LKVSFAMSLTPILIELDDVAVSDHVVNNVQNCNNFASPLLIKCY